ncbi:MAG: ATP synthase F1 subunit delta [Chloroflexota bacterium]|nr:ATP synthase F1 subunit delta [Chloroflexota bacterium]
MARRDTAARRYAEAAFQVAKQDRTLDRWERDLGVVRDALGAAELRRLVEHPAVAYADKDRVVRRALDGRVAAPALNLFLLMVRRGRPGAMQAMIERFGELLRGERGVVRAEVRTALALDDEARSAIERRVELLTGSGVELSEIVDESLIGGVAVRIGDRMYDASVRTRLERLRERLAAQAR